MRALSLQRDRSDLNLKRSGRKREKKDKTDRRKNDPSLSPRGGRHNSNDWDAIRLGETLSSPRREIEDANDDFRNDAYRHLDLIYRSLGLNNNDVAMCMTYVDRLVQNSEEPPLTMSARRKYLTSSIALAQKYLMRVDRLIGATEIQRLMRGYVARSNLLKSKQFSGETNFMVRNETFTKLYSSEVAYGEKLSMIICNYLEPLRDQKKDLISEQERESLFSNVEVLLTTHETILEGLKGCIASHPDLLGVGRVWLGMAPFLKYYGPYVENSAHCLTTLGRLLNNSKFRQFVLSRQEDKLGYTLDQLLQLPITRISEYHNFLETITQHTPTKHQDYDDLNKATDVMKELSKFVDKYLQSAKNRDNVLEVQRRMPELKASIYVSGREYIEEKQIILVVKGKKVPRTGILFNDIILVAKCEKKDTLSLKAQLVLREFTEVKATTEGTKVAKGKKTSSCDYMVSLSNPDEDPLVFSWSDPNEAEAFQKQIEAQISLTSSPSPASPRSLLNSSGHSITDTAEGSSPSKGDNPEQVVAATPPSSPRSPAVTPTSASPLSFIRNSSPSTTPPPTRNDIESLLKVKAVDMPEGLDTDLLVPWFFKYLINTLSKSLMEKGIYRVSGLEQGIKSLRQALDSYTEVDNIPSCTPHVVADVIKLYLRELPEPLLTFSFYDQVVSLSKGLDDNVLAEHIRDLLLEIPLPNYCLTKYLANHLLSVAAYSEHSLMNISNLSIVFGPTVCYPQVETLESTLMMPRIYNVLQVILSEFEIVFGVSPNPPPKLARHVSVRSSSLSAGSMTESSPDPIKTSGHAHSLSLHELPSSLSLGIGEETPISSSYQARPNISLATMDSSKISNSSSKDGSKNDSEDLDNGRHFQQNKKMISKSVSMYIPAITDSSETESEKGGRDNRKYGSAPVSTLSNETDKLPLRHTQSYRQVQSAGGNPLRKSYSKMQKREGFSLLSLKEDKVSSSSLGSSNPSAGGNMVVLAIPGRNGGSLRKSTSSAINEGTNSKSGGKKAKKNRNRRVKSMDIEGDIEKKSKK